MSSTNKVIRVAAAVITNGDKFFATQRGYGEWRGYWEFPGGKIEVGETPKEALRREIKEELDTEINVGDKLCTVEYDYPSFHLSMDCFLAKVKSGTLTPKEHDYPSFHLSMDCFLAKVKSGTLTPKEHDAAKWLHRDELDSINWLPADEVIIKGLKNE